MLGLCEKQTGRTQIWVRPVCLAKQSTSAPPNVGEALVPALNGN